MSVTLPGKVQPASSGLSGFDTDTVINATVAQQFKQAGYSFCIRYISLGLGQLPNDLSATEAAAILNAGLALSAVQHVRYSGWLPSQSVGSSDGRNTAANAASIGLPKGMNLWCDLEGVANDTSEQSVIDYCNAWYSAVATAGYVPGLYVGAGCILNGTQLYDLPFQHYWKSLSTVPDIPKRSYQLIQSLESNSQFGVNIDKDVTQTDKLGGTVLWLAP